MTRRCGRTRAVRQRRYAISLRACDVRYSHSVCCWLPTRVLCNVRYPHSVWYCRCACYTATSGTTIAYSATAACNVRYWPPVCGARY
eukprot:1657284-Rhodomonas_salina.2